MNRLLFQFMTSISVSKGQTQSSVDLGPVSSTGDGPVVLFPFRQFGDWSWHASQVGKMRNGPQVSQGSSICSFCGSVVLVGRYQISIQ